MFSCLCTSTAFATASPCTDLDMAEQIRDELSDVWAKWYEIGVGLKLSTATLDTLEEGSPENKMLVRYFGGWVSY